MQRLLAAEMCLISAASSGTLSRIQYINITFSLNPTIMGRSSVWFEVAAKVASLGEHK